MSFGTFSTNIQGIYSWGVLRNAKFGGMMMDIDRLGATCVDKDNKQSNVLAFTQQQGPRQSLNENQVPEMIFNDPNSTQKNVEGVSAVKILKLASHQGQKIYQIDRNNMNTVLPQLSHDAEVTLDIRNAVAAGKVVTTSEKSINFNSWKGSGYIILDPNTGSGAYMISGGLNGGAVLFTVLAFILVAVIVALIAGPIAGAMITLAFISQIETFFNKLNTMLDNCCTQEQIDYQAQATLNNIGLQMLVSIGLGKFAKEIFGEYKGLGGVVAKSGIWALFTSSFGALAKADGNIGKCGLG